jgi:phenylpyruvate tautomerase PptA (4-oxalocrotonate tautomerase family)
MPILDVTVALRPGESLAPHLARRVADAVAAVVGAPAGSVWVTITALPTQAYAENGVAAAATPRPAFVRILKSRLDEPAALAAEAAALVRALAPLLDRPADLVHLIYEPAASGRIAFGGSLRET